MRVVLPAFAVSTVVAAAGLALVLAGQRTIGVALVAVAALGGMALRTRLVYRAQQQARQPASRADPGRPGPTR